jgi:dTDP-3-amino-3,4,6-trideoxy-alpha-D-glucose transaminase
LLGVVEGLREVGFDFRRFYFLTELAEGAQRGGHAHRRLRQCMISLRGSADVALEGPAGHFRFRLDTPEKALIVPPGYWRTLDGLAPESLVGVLASDYYDEADYIRDYDVFRSQLAGATDSVVPYIDLKRAADAIGPMLSEALSSTLASGQYIGGTILDRFEQEFAQYCQTSRAVGMANGLQALELALRARGVGPGDEVVLPANTFIATALAVTNVGASPVLVDVEPDTGLIDASEIEGRISPRTRAIIPVHLYGHPADMDPILDIGRRFGCFVLEDAAQAHGARYKGRVCGGLGDAAAFSFYPTKNLGALGDAGAVTTSDAGLAATVRKLGNYGASERYHHETVGVNSRLDPIQAAVLSKKLPLLEGWNERRRRLADVYLTELAGIEGLDLPAVRSWAVPVWHVFQVRTPDGQRDRFRKNLGDNGVTTNVHYPVPVHLQKCYQNAGWRPGDFPVAESLCARTVSLPLDPFHRLAEIEKVISCVRHFFGA